MKLYRHRIQIPASVVFDIITDQPEVTEDQVKAAANYHFNLDEGNGLDHTVLDGRFARLYLETTSNGLAIKEFTVEDTSETEDEADVYPCVRCGEVIPDEYKKSHEEDYCNPLCVDCKQPIGDQESMVRNNGQLSHLHDCPVVPQ